MVQLKRNLLSIALGSAAMMLAMQAHAQSADQTDEDAQATKKKDDDAKNLDKVTVTGIRGAIERAIDMKQESTSIVEAVSSEDIGKLPDQSIADSLARLPGLTAQRERGRAQQINIRGFDGNFSSTTLNGREQATTSDSRGVEFDQYPSELLSSVVVYKTPDAKLVGQGLSGTVDLRTVRPLDYDKQQLSFGARYDQNKIRGQKETGYRYNLAYIDQFADNTIGLAIGFAHMDSPQPGYQNEPWGYTGFRGDPALQVIGGSKFYKFNVDNKRDGVMATMQFRPNDFWEGTVDWMYSRYDRAEIKTGTEFWTEWGGGTDVLPGWSASNGTVTASDWTGVYPVVKMDSNPTKSRLDSIGFNNKFKLSENWTLNADLSYSRARNNYKNVESYAGIKDGTTTMHFELDPSGMFYNYTFGVDLGNPDNLVIRGVPDWGGQGGYYKNFNVEDKVQAIRLNLVRSFDSGAFSSIDFGLNFTKRSKFKTDYEAQLCLVDCTGGMAEFVPFTGSVIDFGVGGIDKLAIYDADAMVAAGTWKIIDSPLDWFWGKSWEVEEKLTTAYFQANIDTDLGKMPLRGNVGFQYVRADQHGEGWTQFNNAGTTVIGALTSYGDKYGNFLPSLNLGLEVMPELQVRLAAARQVMRPPMGDMRGGMSVGVCDTGCASQPIWSANGGNPGLRPWLANAYDLSIEKYFSTKAGNRGYLGVAYFYKDLVSYVWGRTVPFDFAGLPLPPQAPGQTNYPTTTVGQISQPANGKNGSIKGTEATLSVPLDLLWAPLNGLGIMVSYSDTSSGIRMKPDDPNSYPLPGLSRTVASGSVYYERAGFSLRYNARKRSRYVGSVRNYEGVINPEWIDGETVQDAQVSYSFNSGRLEGLSLYLQVANIGDEPFTRSLPAGPTTYWEYGRTTLIGFSYKF